MELPIVTKFKQLNSKLSRCVHAWARQPTALAERLVKSTRPAPDPDLDGSGRVEYKRR